MRIPLLMLALSALALAGCSDDGDDGNDGDPQTPGGGGSSASCIADAPVAHTVGIHNSRYDPATVDGQLCDTIAWTNHDSFQHSATADDGSFDIVIAPGATEEHLFAEGGSHPYHCKFHPSMKGTIVTGEEGTIA